MNFHFTSLKGKQTSEQIRRGKLELASIRQVASLRDVQPHLGWKSEAPAARK